MFQLAFSPSDVGTELRKAMIMGVFIPQRVFGVLFQALCQGLQQIAFWDGDPRREVCICLPSFEYRVRLNMQRP